MTAIVEGLQHIADPTLLIAMVLAVAFAQVCAIIPGLGGAFILAILIPFLYPLDPLVAITVLVAAGATDGTGNSVTSILFGVPGSATGTAALLDGHPMAKRGEAGRALGAAMTASAFGGVLGAITLALIIPVVRPLVLLFGPAEFFVLVLAALFALAYVREEALVKGLVSGALGLTLSFVGMDGATGMQRYTLGELYLWDGLKLVPVLLGLFAIPEVINLLTTSRRGGHGGLGSDAIGAVRGARRGIIDTFRHADAAWMSSWIGLGIGIIPGVGGAAGQFMAYSAVAKMSGRRSQRDELPPFGKGNIRGVIAADAGTNSTVGGELVPTLAFGVPGSSTMAIILGALITMGITPGPSMLQSRLDIVWMIVLVLVISNLLATGLVLTFANRLAGLVRIRPSLLAPGILAVTLFGAYATSRHVGDILTTVFIGVLAFFLHRFGYGRITFIIGFVLGPILEHNFVLSLQIFGPTFLFQRPLAASMLALLVGASLWSLISTLRGRVRRTHDVEENA